MNEAVTVRNMQGRVRAFRAFPASPMVNLTNPPLKGLWLPMTEWKSNLIMFGWGEIVTKLMSSRGNGNYAIGGMYLEFKNVTNPSDVVTAPAFDRTGGITYYNDLSVSPDTDYLRVPLIAAVPFRVRFSMNIGSA